MKRYLSFVSLMMVIVALVFSGCSKAHEEARAAAEAAMKASLSAGADRYSTADFVVGKKLWLAAEAQVKEKNYREAKQGYIDAKIAFEKAAGAVEANKAAMIPKAAEAVGAVEAGWKNLEIIAKKQENKMVKGKMWEANLKKFLEDLETAKGMVNSDPAAALAKTTQLMSFIDSYNEYFKNLAANPRKVRQIKRDAVRRSLPHPRRDRE